MLHDRSKGREEAEIEQSIRFIKDWRFQPCANIDRTPLTEDLQIRSLKPHCTVQMLKQSTRCRYQYIHPPHGILFFLQGLTPNDKPRGEVEVPANRFQLLKRLNGQLPSWGDNQSAKSVVLTPFETVKAVQDGYEESERLA